MDALEQAYQKAREVLTTWAAKEMLWQTGINYQRAEERIEAARMKGLAAPANGLQYWMAIHELVGWLLWHHEPETPQPGAS